MYAGQRATAAGDGTEATRQNLPSRRVRAQPGLREAHPLWEGQWAAFQAPAFQKLSGRGPKSDAPNPSPNIRTSEHKKYQSQSNTHIQHAMEKGTTMDRTRIPMGPKPGPGGNKALLMTMPSP